MNILVDVRHLSDRHKTGVGEYTSALLRALFSLEDGTSYELLSSGMRRPDIDTTHLKVPNKLLKLTTYFAAQPKLDLLGSTRADLVWLPNLNFAALSPSVPYVLTLHDLSFKIFPEFFSARMRLWHRGTRPERLVQGARAIIVPSTATKEDAVRFFGIPAERIHVVPHGVDPAFSPAFTAQDHGVRGKHKLPKRFALFVGTLEPRKNVVALVDSVEAYRKQSGDDLHLVLVGGWGWKSGAIRKRIENVGWIHHLGYVPRSDLPAIYRAATVFAWPSVYEGFGLPVLEAMASGTPVITSHTSSLPELTGNAAVLVNPFRPEEITQALEQLLSSPALRDRLSHTALERARTYTWERTALATRNVFENLR